MHPMPSDRVLFHVVYCERVSARAIRRYARVFGGLAMTAALWFGLEAQGAILTPQWPTLQEWLLLAALGVIATAGPC